jgi:hypothetical protein
VGPLHCIPVLLKDQVETSDMPTTYGSAIFKAFVPRRDATITIRMKKAGAIPGEDHYGQVCRRQHRLGLWDLAQRLRSRAQP